MDGAGLLHEAREALRNAHAPYSRFRVGAAALASSGTVYRGCNIENVSFGLGLCAERVAVFSALAAGATEIVAVAITTERDELVTPCGACREVLATFAPRARIFLADRGGMIREVGTADLLPGREGTL
jgi:cytidine deaminase